MPDDVEDGFCPAGRATLRAHQDLINRHEDGLRRLDAKIDRLVFMLMTTLLTAIVNLVLHLME